MESKLQIISGKYRGRKLSLPAGARPTQNRARVALFNMLAPMIESARKFIVWDAFAGSGAFGLEMLSRYQDVDVVFTDVSPESIQTVRKNLAQIGATAMVAQTDAIGAIRAHGDRADLVFIDPPYAEHTLGISFFKKFTSAAKPGTILVWEMEKDAPAPIINNNDWTVLRDKTYGRARFFILKKN